VAFDTAVADDDADDMMMVITMVSATDE